MIKLKPWFNGLIFFSVSLIGSANNLPQFNSAAQGTLSSIQEAVIGSQFYGYILSTSNIVHDPFVQQYVTQLGYRLRAVSPKPGQALTFFVIKDESLNAFAGPGGYIGINTGTIIAAKTEGELAGVMAHEIAHVLQRHIARGIEQAKRDQLLSLGSVLAALAVGGSAAGGLASAGGASSFERGMHTSREFEQEADRLGIQILQKAGFKAADMTNFVANISRGQAISPVDEIAEQFQSHPLAAKRFAESSLQSGSEKASPASLKYQLIQARAMTETVNDLPKAIRDIKKQSTHPTLAMQYALACLYLKAKQAKSALPILEAINQKQRENVLIESTLAEALIDTGKKAAGFKLFQQIHYYEPENLALTQYYADALIHDKQYKKAITLLQNLDEEQQNTMTSLDLLAYAQGKSGDIKLALITRAKLYATVGQFQQALTQLQRAKSMKSHPGYNLRIDRLMQSYKTSLAILK